MEKLTKSQATIKKSAKKVSGYKTAGTLSDGVIVLVPKTKPEHFKAGEIRSTIRKLAAKKSA
jgi:hypothetical protein